MLRIYDPRARRKQTEPGPIQVFLNAGETIWFEGETKPQMITGSNQRSVGRNTTSRAAKRVVCCAMRSVTQLCREDLGLSRSRDYLRPGLTPAIQSLASLIVRLEKTFKQHFGISDGTKSRFL
jgi:hypothetical protein